MVADSVETVVSELVLANHILAALGVLDAFGHVSARHPGLPGCFLLARSMAPALVGPADILCFGPDSELADGRDERVYLERFIHGEIYRARPDVGAVAHSHSPSIIPFGVVASAPLRPVFHMAGFIGDRAPVFEIRDSRGDHPDLLISDRALGAALAEQLGDQGLVLMRGHGSTAVGVSIRQAVYRAVYAEVNARLQCEALRLGEPTYLSGPEAAASAAANDTQLDRAWSHWTRLVERGQTGDR